MPTKFEISEEFANIRVDKVLPLLMPEISRTLGQKFIKENKVILNGRICNDISHKVLNGDILEVGLSDNKLSVTSKIEANSKIPIDVIFEDEHLLVINKQAGLTVHPGAGNHTDTLVNALLARYGNDLSMLNGTNRAGIVHRLDRDTTGVLLIAKDDYTHRELARQIKEREAKRIYHALVWNKPRMVVGKIITNMGRHPSDRKKRSVFKTAGKVAITNYKVIESYYDDTITLLEVSLDTGRTHQIRVHMEHMGMPVVGDKVYKGNINQKKSGSLPEKIRDKVVGFPRQALHARKIIFTHPHTLEEMEVEADYPKDLKDLLKGL